MSDDSFNCPYCNDLFSDCVYEYFGGNSDSAFIKCDCGKEFECTREYSVEYETHKIPCFNGEPHDFKFYYVWEEIDFFKCKYCSKVERRPKLTKEPTE